MQHIFNVLRFAIGQMPDTNTQNVLLACRLDTAGAHVVPDQRSEINAGADQ